MVKVRFAPSPTGFLHIGGARTALFNWMYARSQQGVFVLRIEDTDQIRSKKEYEDEILQSMKWLGLDWDELYYQSQRFDVYRQQAMRLVEEGKAYQDGNAILLKTIPQEVKVFDVIRGEVVFDTANFIQTDEQGRQITGEDGKPVLKDEVLIKSDGSPAYSFCCVVDDALMEITHVIRGEDHISNTPKQLLMYQALGFKPPKFAHLPLIMGEEGGRLSKRHGAVAVSEYRRAGFLAEALINYLTLLGWSPGGDQEIIAMRAALQKFSLKKINKAAAVFSLEKLTWVNTQYIKNKSAEEIAELLIPFLQETRYIDNEFDRTRLIRIVSLYHTRIPTLKDFLGRADFFFKDDFAVEEGACSHLSPQALSELGKLAAVFEEVSDFTEKNLEGAFRNFVDSQQLKMSDLVHPARVALTGKTIGPGLFETMAVLGKDSVVKRLRGTTGK